MRRFDRRRREWVSKSDIIRYERCPYAWWAFENGQMVHSPLALALLERGNRVDVQIAADPDPTAEQVSALADDGPVTIGQQRFEDRRRKIYGIPDGTVAMPDGAVAALEVKSHGRPHRTDDLELAFYSLLLSRHFGTPIADRGFLVTVALDGSQRCHLRQLTEDFFDRVNELIRLVREGRRSPPSDRYCGCPTCKARLTDKRERRRLERDELTMLWNLGRAKAAGLAKVGIATITQLSDADPNTLLDQLSDAGIRHRLNDIQGWQAHATAYRTQAPVVFNRLEVPEPPYYLLDTEYDTHDRVANPIFLIALGRVPPSGDLEKPHTWWAPTPELEKEALLGLKAALESNQDWPIVTYYGNNADLPRLREAQHRLGATDIAGQIAARHIDLFAAVKAALRLPTAGLSLKEVEPFAGITREGHLVDAQTALATYRRYKQRPTPQGVEALKTYAAEDIVGLAEVLTYLREISRPEALAEP